MRRYLRALSLCFLATLLIIITIPRSRVNAVATESYPTTQISLQAQASSPSETTTPQPKEQNYPVTLDGEALFSYSSIIEGIPAKNRAEEVSKTIEKVAKNFAIELDSLQILPLEGLRLILEGEDTVFVVLEADARVANKPLDKLANEYLATTKDAIARYRVKYSRKRLLLRIGFVIGETIILILAIVLLRKLLNTIIQRIQASKSILFRPLSIQDWQVLSVGQQANLASSLAGFIYWLAVAAIFFVYVSLLTFHLPQTQPWREAVFQSLLEFLDNLGQSAIAYLPNLFTIILSVITAYYLRRINFAVF